MRALLNVSLRKQFQRFKPNSEGAPSRSNIRRNTQPATGYADVTRGLSEALWIVTKADAIPVVTFDTKYGYGSKNWRERRDSNPRGLLRDRQAFQSNYAHAW